MPIPAVALNLNDMLLRFPSSATGEVLNRSLLPIAKVNADKDG